MITFCHKIAVRIILLVFSKILFYPVIAVFLLKNSYFAMDFIIGVLSLLNLFIKTFFSVGIGNPYIFAFFTKPCICLTAPAASQEASKITFSIIESSEIKSSNLYINPVIYIVSAA